MCLNGRLLCGTLLTALREEKKRRISLNIGARLFVPECASIIVAR